MIKDGNALRKMFKGILHPYETKNGSLILYDKRAFEI